MIESRFVWSATLAIVVTARLMCAARSLMTESLEPIEVVDSASCRIDRPISARLPCPSPAMLGGLGGDLVDLVHRLEELQAGGRDLLDGGGGLAGRGPVVADGLALLPGRGGDLGGRGHQRDARLLDPADQRAEVAGHRLDGPEELAGLARGRRPRPWPSGRPRPPARPPAAASRIGREIDRATSRATTKTARPAAAMNHADRLPLLAEQLERLGRVLLDGDPPAERRQVGPGRHHRLAQVVDHLAEAPVAP